MADPPTLLRDGRYRVLGVLGEGTQAQTLAATDEREGGRAVAIKRFVVRGAKSWKDVELAEREARVLSSLSHPHLPAYVEHFEENGELYLVMELAPGESLQALRKRGGRLGRDEVLRLLSELRDVLGYLHSRSPPIIHRDVKPGNVIRRPDGSFVLVDFGSVRDRLRLEGGSTVVGTFGYMAPEQFQGRAMPESDVYGAGATALALLTGEEPENLPHRGLKLDVERVLASDPELAALLSKLLEPDPDARAKAIPEIALRAEAAPEREPPSPSRRPAEPAETERHSSAPREDTIPLPVLMLLLTGLLVARVSVRLSVAIFVPTLLFTLSLVFGGALRRASHRVREAASRADAALSRAARVLRRLETTSEAEPVGERSRVRVDPGTAKPRSRVVVETTAEPLDEAQGPDRSEAREPRS
jgi:serine/threonine protein kinase